MAVKVLTEEEVLARLPVWLEDMRAVYQGRPVSGAAPEAMRKQLERDPGKFVDRYLTMERDWMETLGSLGSSGGGSEPVGADDPADAEELERFVRGLIEGVQS